MPILDTTCQYCNKPFSSKTTRTGFPARKYCSRKCFHASTDKRFERPCDRCGKVFISHPDMPSARERRFCSRECRLRGTSKNVELICPTCGKSFKRRPSSAKAKGAVCCSRECQWEYRRKPKKRFYRGHNWRLQRELVYQRDGDVCQYCHKKRQRGARRFPVHHIRPYREFNEDYVAANDLSNLITLCRPCHTKAEYGLIPIQRPLI
jgi:hypothetical protein